jgi:hypothetical protein
MNVSLQKPVRGFGKATLTRCASSARNFQTVLSRLQTSPAMKPGDYSYTLVVRVTW